MPTLYLMLKPDEPAGRRAYGVATELKTERGLYGRPTDWDRLHVTLAALAPTGRGGLKTLSLALGGLSMPPFVVALDRTLSFRRQNQARPLVLLGDDGVFGIRLLHDEIERRLRYAGVWFKPGVGATPHLTLLRDHATVPETFVAPVSWTVREIQLVYSIVETRQHITLERWPLGRDEPPPPSAPRLC